MNKQEDKLSIQDRIAYHKSCEKKLIREELEKHIDYPIGLTNIGNTCFLNSIIQFLYGIQDLRQSLIINRVKQNGYLSGLLGSILHFLEQKRKDEWMESEKLLWKISESLIAEGIRFSRYSQESSLNVLIQILNIIEKELQIFQSKTMICYKAICSCHQFHTNDRILPYKLMQCVDCKQQIKRILIIAPKYIMYFNPLKQKVMMKIQEYTKNQKITYTYKAQIIYYGNGEFGHYFTRRIQGDSQFQLNDSEVKVRQIISSQNRGSIGLILLYKMSLKTPKKFYRKISNPQSQGLKFKEQINVDRSSKIYQKLQFESN